MERVRTPTKAQTSSEYLDRWAYYGECLVYVLCVGAVNMCRHATLPGLKMCVDLFIITHWMFLIACIDIFEAESVK